MKAKHLRPRTRNTLFSPAEFSPVHSSISQLKALAQKRCYDEREQEVFEALLADDAAYEPAPFADLRAAGPAIIEVRGRRYDLSAMRTVGLPEPTWDEVQYAIQPLPVLTEVEADALKFVSSRAKGILLIESGRMASMLMAHKAWRSLGLLLVSSWGVPRARVRRFLHRFCERFGCPVYLLADNSTWGYYIFSVLKRGLCNPDRVCPGLRIEDVRFLGARAGDWRLTGSRDNLILWKPKWSLRLRAMLKYPCFASAAWRKEFAAFRQQHGMLQLAELTTIDGYEWFIGEYLKERLQRGEWLT